MNRDFVFYRQRQKVGKSRYFVSETKSRKSPIFCVRDKKSGKYRFFVRQTKSIVFIILYFVGLIAPTKCIKNKSRSRTARESEMMNVTEFFMAMIPPTATKQARGWNKTKNGKVISYDRANADTEGKLTSHLAQHIPPQPYTGPIRLIVKWLFPLKGNHKDGEWYTNKPDYDNLPKAMNDIMTKLGYWTDDCIIASGITEKFWAAQPGIYVRIEELSNGDR